MVDCEFDIHPDYIFLVKASWAPVIISELVMLNLRVTEIISKLIFLDQDNYNALKPAVACVSRMTQICSSLNPSVSMVFDVTVAFVAQLWMAMQLMCLRP